MSAEPGILQRSDASPASSAAVLCSHCGLVVPAGLVEAGAAHQFCCGGCRAVYETIHACGLESYYKFRQIADATAKPAQVGQDSFDAFDSEAFGELYIRRDGGSATVDLVLEGVTCAACVWLVERLPKVLDGVIEARLSLRQAMVRVTWDPQKVKLSRVARTLNSFGYCPHAAKANARAELLLKEERKRLVHLGAAGAIMGNVMLLHLALYAGGLQGMEVEFKIFFQWLSAILAVISLSWPGAIFFRSAWGALRARVINFDVSIALALLVGGVAGLVNTILNRSDSYFDSLTALVFLLLVGRYLQYRQQRRADGAVELLFSLTPSICHRIDGEQILDIPAEALQSGDLVEVRGGELIPADGTVEAGESAVEQALLTGESMPTRVGAGDTVYGGSQNTTAVLRVRVTRTGQETRVGQLMRLVERGVQEKPQIVLMADRVASWFVVVVSVAAALVLAYWSQYSIPAAVDHAVALLIVTCPCVLGLATPLTISIAIGRLARRDVLVKSGAALETLARRGRIILDKTGTLTHGRLQLIEWAGDSSARSAVACLERRSSHPIARALAEGADELVAVDQVVEKNDGGIVGQVGGVNIRVGSPAHFARHGIVVSPELEARRVTLEAGGATVVLVAREGQCVGLAALADSLREDARESIRRLGLMEWEPWVVSGDAPGAVAVAASAAGIDSSLAFGAVSPEDKLNHVKHRAGEGVTTVMVGDGVNDAAALAAADVGIAVHGGAEASLAAADVYVARPGLAPLVDLVETARHTMRVVRRNLMVSAAYNLLAGVLAAMGLMHPLLAAILMPVSSATVLSLAITSISSDRGARQWK